MQPLTSLIVRPMPGAPHHGLLTAAGRHMPCRLGRAGIRAIKREGDGATPRAVLHPLQVFFRPDRIARPASFLPVAPLRRDDGWCDAPADANYNRPVSLPYPASHERMWRDDHLYDIVVVLDWNTGPVAKGCGSAIFLHLTRPDRGPTEGCIALPMDTLRPLVARLCRETCFVTG